MLVTQHKLNVNFVTLNFIVSEALPRQRRLVTTGMIARLVQSQFLIQILLYAQMEIIALQVMLFLVQKGLIETVPELLM